MNKETIVTSAFIVQSSVVHSLRPYWTAFLSTLQDLYLMIDGKETFQCRTYPMGFLQLVRSHDAYLLPEHTSHPEHGTH